MQRLGSHDHDKSALLGFEGKWREERAFAYLKDG